MRRTSYLNYLLGFLLISLIAYGSYSLGRQGYELEWQGKSLSLINSNREHKNVDADFSVFWKAYDLLNQKYISAPLDGKNLVYGAARGLYAALGDPYNMFLTPDDNKDINSELAGKYEGIGAELGIKSGQLVVVSPLDGSPAKAAGIKTGDAVVKIDGRDTVGISLSEAVSKIRGTAGTKVILTVRHLLSDNVVSQSSESANFSPSQDISVTRAPIKIESVKWEDKGNGIAYVRVSRFGDTTDDEWDKAVADIKSRMAAGGSGLRAVIIDLRSNPGGYFQAAIHLASEFISGGVVSYQEFTHGLRQEYKVDHSGLFTKIPGVVIVNQGSASSSEIVTGALKDRRGFKVVGEKSFGKGTVQDAETLEDGSGVHITIARWLTPNGYNIHGSGIEPDVKVENSDTEVNNGKDPQVLKAIEIARNL